MPGLKEFLSEKSFTQGVGVRVIVHPADKKPIPYKQGWDVAAGKMTTISLQVFTKM